ncbi:MAG: DUF58 domain-containing protein [candidate division WOR-3 bacterium]
MELLRPEILEKIKALDLRAKIIVKGFLSGLHESPYHGFSLEFKEHRPYYKGDPINKIDWKLYGRTERFFLKKYEAETNLSAFLLVDKSNSMNFGEEISKFQYTRTLAASLAYLLLRQNDSVGLVLFSAKIESFIPPRSQMNHLTHLLSSLSRNEPSGKTSLCDVIFELLSLVKKRALFIIFSDLLETPSNVTKTINIMRAKKHEIIIFHILDRKELEFPFRKEAIFRDMEDLKTLSTDPKSINLMYKDRFKKFLEAYKSGFAPKKIDYSQITTDTPYDYALVTYLKKRKRLL